MTKFYKKYRYFATTECADWSSVAQQRPGAGAFSTAPALAKKSGSGSTTLDTRTKLLFYAFLKDAAVAALKNAALAPGSGQQKNRLRLCNTG